METLLVDTDVIIDFLRGYHVRTKNVFTHIEHGKIKAFLSAVSIIELYTGHGEESPQKRDILKTLLSFFEVIPLTHDFAREAGIVRRKYKMGLADAIIAATSIEKKITLFTFNVKHFKHVSEVKFYTV